MIDPNLSNQLKQLIDTARTIFIVYPNAASVDHKAVAASLYLSLLRAKKSVGLISPESRAVEAPVVIAGLEHTQHALGNQNLSISFPYSPDQVDKVSYHIGEETHRFFLSIKPKPGVAPLDASQVEFSYTGASADVVIIVGVRELEELEQIYFGYEQLYTDTPTISINSFTTSFGTHKLDTGSASSSSELLTQLLPEWGLTIDSDIATNLLAGIEANTKNLSAPTTSAETFEAVAQLLRSGARRSFKRPSSEQNDSSVAKNASETSIHDQASQYAVVTEEQSESPQTVITTEDALTSNTSQKLLEEENKKKPSKTKSKKDSLNPPSDYTPSRLM
jgi:hypothetical protein